MDMNRRELIKLMASAGVMMSLPINPLWAKGTTPNRYLIVVNAGGGWDVTSICDPKGEVEHSPGRGFMNKYKTADIRRAGNLRYAPIAPGASVDYDWMEHFYETYQQKMVVINGLNCFTGSHAQGSYYLASGQSFAGFPTLAALHAVPHKAGMAVPYYSAGGHTATAGEVSAIRIGSSASIKKLVNVHPDQPNNISQMLQDKQKALLDHMGYNPETPSVAETWKKFSEARISSRDIASVTDYLPANPSTGSKFQAEMAAALLASGQCAAAAFGGGGGFDKHADSDKGTVTACNNLFENLDHLMKELQRQGIANKTTILVGSEFGRTPWYNSKKGKDHWSTGSAIVIGDNINGNRMVGGSSDQLRPRRVNPETLAFDDNGIQITIQHVHRALRNHLGWGKSELSSKYPIPVENLNLFS